MAEIELDLLPKEREIGHLEEKGIKLMQNGDFEGAVNALNIANQLFPLIPSHGFLIILISSIFSEIFFKWTKRQKIAVFLDAYDSSFYHWKNFTKYFLQTF